MVAPFAAVIVSNTISTTGQVSYRVVDRLGATVQAEQTHVFPTSFSSADLLRYLENVLSALEQESVVTSAGASVRFPSVNQTLADRRSLAETRKDTPEADGIEWRALCLIILDEFNVLRQWLAAFKTEVAAASNLTDLKTRVATLPNTPDRTIAQLKTAYGNKIAAGSAD
jgi:hypothetical protein